MSAVSSILLVLITFFCKRAQMPITHAYPLQRLANMAIRQSVPPLGVYIIAGCGADLFVNICLTLLGYVSFLVLFTSIRPSIPKVWARIYSAPTSNRYFPGHIHAFYLEYVYYDRREQAKVGRVNTTRAPGVYSDRIQTGGVGYGYGTIQPTA